MKPGRIGQGGEAGGLDQNTEEECQDPISPDMAVPHNGELAVAIGTAAESVGCIGETIFMQGSGQQGEKGQRQTGSGKSGETCCGERCQHQSSGSANRRPGERESPHGFGQGYERQVRRHRHPGKKTEARREIGGPAFYNVGSGISRSHGVVIMRRLSVVNNISKTQTRKKDERDDRPSL